MLHRNEKLSLGRKPGVSWEPSNPSLMDSFLIVIGICFFISTCGGDSVNTTAPPIAGQSLDLRITPTEANLIPNEVLILTVTAFDQFGSEVSVDGLSWSSDSPSTASVNSSGVVRAESSGTTSVWAHFTNDSVEATITVNPFPVSETVEAEITGTVVVPKSIDRETIFISTGVGGARPISQDNSFEVQGSTTTETLVFAQSGSTPFALGIAMPGQELQLNASETAQALVYFHPVYLFAPSYLTAEILDHIASLEEIDQLTQAIRQQVQDLGGLDLSDSSLVDAYGLVIAAGESDFEGSASGSALGRARVADSFGKSFVFAPGITMEVGPPNTIEVEVSFRNSYQRWVTVYQAPTDLMGQLSGGGRAISVLPAADMVPEYRLASVPDWYAAFYQRFRHGLFSNDTYDASIPISTRVTFSPERPAVIFHGYGPGWLHWEREKAEIAEEGTTERVGYALAATLIMEVILPAVGPIIGVTVDKESAIENVRSVVMDWDFLPDLIGCFDQIPRFPEDWQDASLESVVCSYKVFLDQGFSNPKFWTGIAQVVSREEFSLEEIAYYSRKLHVYNHIFDLATLASDIGPLGFSIANSPLRAEFTLSYNHLLGADLPVKLGGDSQIGTSGETLPDPLTVQVVDITGGNPVSGAWVAWQPGEASGSPSDNLTITDGNGETSVRWTLGSGSNQTMRAILAGSPASTKFTAQVNGTQTCVPGTGPWIYAISRGPVGGSTLYTVELSECGTDVVVGEIHTAVGDKPGLVDLATLPDGTLLGASLDALYVIDASTAVATKIGKHGIGYNLYNGLRALGADAFGNAFGATYASCGSGSLYSFDTTTGLAQQIGQLGEDGDYCSGYSAQDIEFAPDGRAFAAGEWDDSSTPDEILMTVDTATGASARVHPTNQIGFAPLGFAFASGRLFGLTGSKELIEINLADGTGELVRTLEFSIHGAASQIPVP